MREDRSFLICLWTALVGGAYGEFRGDPNYHTETPSPPFFMTMAGPTHVLVHVNPDIHKNHADKIVDYFDKPNLTDFTAFCRCWRSRDFPYCNGFHHDYNKLLGDNVGPILIRRKNVTNAGIFYRRMRRLSINVSDAGTPPMCSATIWPITPPPKIKRPMIDSTVDVDKIWKDYGDMLFNFTKHLDDFINMPNRLSSYVPPPPNTEQTTEPEPTLWYPTYRMAPKGGVSRELP
ncbi:uncharacterized protein LOC103522248 [Diaphorina citri]|uniref:CDGSH iron-sulfur domain-containing protein 2 homologue n=1 Tax=Diaphorina citri TaxID=121845 RepID=A0A1S3DP04_DIACI|nr:uncharacterized protein LOC103522248 [Diaphorina citri]